VKSVRVLSPCFRSFDDAIVVLSDGHPSRVRRCAMGWDIRREGRAWSGNALDRYELAPGKIELIITCGCAAPPSESRALSEITTSTASDGTLQPPSQSYAALARDDGRTWCAYTDPSEFESEVTKLMPAESARVAYNATQLVELTYQVQPESDDWIVVDLYTPTDARSPIPDPRSPVPDPRSPLGIY
jgi:hypothetical protein